ncbi:PAS domain S-box protein [Methanogenium cariaci]|uniref:PAS domain S-box protein n=1 Tax=Methanogenium cariaci TaxID=2197 RepID=UPI000781119C|nr:PAS domain S-box protein [Methanogenium cariaci]
MEEALKESEEKFKSYVAYAREGIYIVDPSGKIIDANPAASDILGYTKDELVTFTIPELVPPEDIEYAMTRFCDVVEVGHLSEEFVTVRKDGMHVPVIINAVMLPDGNTLAIHTNISELKRAEEGGVREANKKLNLLSSITRHDILNQLTAVIACLEIIEMVGEIPEGSETEKYLRKISGASETIKTQVLFTKDYKDLGGEQVPKWQNVGGAIVDDTAKIPAFESMTVENRLEDLEIYADPLFEKVIYTLFDNTIRHGGEKTSTIRFAFIPPSSDGITIICEDDGMGVPDAYKEKIFNRQHYTNTGLGLFLSGDILSITKISMKETGVYGKGGARFEMMVPAGMFRFR